MSGSFLLLDSPDQVLVKIEIGLNFSYLCIHEID
jgi:hypothetical protein